jgi:hypothetical protein
MILEMAIACFLDNAVKKSQKLTKKETNLAVKRKKEHKNMTHNPHAGSDFDDFLREEGLYEECNADSWCVAIASGQSWNGFRTTQGKVLIIQTDEPDVISPTS